MIKETNTKKGVVILLIASVLWGLAFCFQSIGGKETGAYTFNGLRMLFGSICLLPVIKIFDSKGFSPNRPKNRTEWKQLWKMGTFCGVFLAMATNLQQIALNLGAEAGKAGFLTTIYIILIPLVGIFLKKKIGWNIWIAVVIALAGMYFLCIDGSFAIAIPDLLLILCAFAFTFHICTIDLCAEMEALRLTAIQFFVCGLISSVLMVVFDILPHPGGFAGWAGVFSSTSFWLTMLYVALFSGCIGYTLQIIGQRILTPPIASLIMCLESVFSVIFGYFILHETMDERQLLGCGLIFASIIIAQIRKGKRAEV